MHSIREIHQKFENKECTCVDVVEQCLKRVELYNSRLNALLGIADDVMQQAKEVDAGKKTGELLGIPIILKDNILVRGQRATAGSKILENYTSPYDSTVVTRLKNAGAVLLGRANLDEFAMGSSTETSHFGPTRNPWDTECVPGGSSGGSAASVAAEFAPVAFGSDTGGSIRQPASLCGVVGMKPTYGRVSRYGLIAMASSLDQIGPITQTVEDAALVMRVIEGRDPKDASSAELPNASIPELTSTDLTGLRIGLPKEYFLDGLDSDVKQAVLDSVGIMELAGASVQEVSLPHTRYGLATYYLVMFAESSSNLGRYDGMRYGYSSTGASLFDTYAKSRSEGFGTEVKRRILLGTYTLSAGYYDAYYRRALQMRGLIRRDFDNVFKEVDVIVSPTSPTVAWKLGAKMDDPVSMYLSDVYTVSANLAAIPAISFPCGFSQGLPIGVQLMAASFNENILYRAGMVYQQHTNWHKRFPNIV